MTDAIQIRGLSYQVGGFALRDVNLSVPSGAVYGFLGPNGAGKTTTIRLLLGLLRPAGGSMKVFGEDVPKDIVSILGRVGYVPERPQLYPNLSIDEAIRFHAAFHPRYDQAASRDLAARFELPMKRALARLSKGEMGKVMILLALAQRPDLLVLDEPTDGLDPVVRREALHAILDYVTESGATVLISSHLVHELERFCDWIGVLDQGTIVAQLPMQEFKSGLKRLRVGAGAPSAGAPFALLARGAAGIGGEVWTVRGWQPDMASWFGEAHPLREVVDLDLEEAFVELLRSARHPSGREA
ncbi:MAG TPA: ABC transporter ATP-binding protein [Gemmatimonadales bacterium]|nr:ABC transporter ATP-binding protein [Gemmatimonadales bacterium]HRZ09251.1 ABC transporter ATP-binding protein [Gemmatimonadales bacterium]